MIVDLFECHPLDVVATLTCFMETMVLGVILKASVAIRKRSSVQWSRVS